MDPPSISTREGFQRRHAHATPAAARRSPPSPRPVSDPGGRFRTKRNRRPSHRTAGSASSEEGGASILEAFLKPNRAVHAHCDLPCGVYDPAQARIEAESVKACQEKYQGERRPTIFEEPRASRIKEERADLVKHHLWVLWTDYFKPEHLEKYPDLHEKFWNATKLAGASKKSRTRRRARSCSTRSTRSRKIFWETKS